MAKMAIQGVIDKNKNKPQPEKKKGIFRRRKNKWKIDIYLIIDYY